MRPRSTLVLVAVLVLLCAGYWGMNSLRARRVEEAQQARRIFDFEGARVKRMGIAQINQPVVEGERVAEGRWRITAPNDTIPPLHPLWDRVAERLAGLVNQRTVLSSPGDLAQYGLDVPALTVTAEVEGRAPLRLVFGDVEPTQRNRYARLDDGPLFLVPTESFFELNRSLEELRHRFLVENREADILEVQFAWVWTGNPDAPEEEQPELGEESTVITLKRDAPGAPWRMTSPVEAPANQERAEEFVKEVQFAVCRNYVDNPGDLSDYGLKPPAARITVADSAGGRAQNILIGALDAQGGRGGVYAQVAGRQAVFQVDAHLLTLLPRTPLQWRENRLLTRRVTDIRRIDYRRGGDGFVLEKDGAGEWKLVSPAMEDVNQFAVSGFLAVFKESGGTPLDIRPATLDTPGVTMDITYDDGGTARLVMAPSAEDPETWHATQDSGGVVEMKGVAVDALLTDSADFRSREVLRFPAPDAVRLEFQFENLGVVMEKRHGQWVVTRPEGLRLTNQSDADLLMGAVNPLRASGVEREEAPDEPALFGLDKPVFTLYVTVSDPAAAGGETRLGPLKIGAVSKEHPQERYAVCDGRAGLFRVDQEVVDTLREAMRGFEEAGNS